MFIVDVKIVFGCFSPSFFPSSVANGCVILKYLMYDNNFLHDQSEPVEQYWTEQQRNVLNFTTKTQNHNFYFIHSFIHLFIYLSIYLFIGTLCLVHLTSKLSPNTWKRIGRRKNRSSHLSDSFFFSYFA